jgi:polar amino acid transport system substrate-binding protein
MPTFRSLIAAAAMALAALPSPAQEKTPMDPRLITPGKLTVGTGDVVYPPWMLNNDPAGGEGFENGLVYALAEKMGFAREDVVWVGLTFDQTIAPGDKPFDFALQQISITEARAQVVSFSEPYYQPDKAVVALPTSPVTAARSFAELRKARWGAAVGTTDLAYLETVVGVGDVAVFNDQAAVFLALQSGQIDATVVALPTALYATAVQVPEAAIVAVLPPDANDRGLGLLFQKDNPLVPWVNEALAAIIADGTVEALKQKYLIANPDLPVITE